jgi:protein SCO1/2
MNLASPKSRPVSRRSLLKAAPAVIAPAVFPLTAARLALAEIQSDHGRIKPPVPIPDIKVRLNSGSATSLSELASGRATAIQLMFTQCTTTCPIQAAIFQRVQHLLPDMAARNIQLLSLSVDPQADSPKAMSAWLRRFHAGPNWIGAAPAPKDGPALQNFFGRAGGAFASHSTQVNLVDRHGRLVYRTVELPTAGEIVDILQKL